MSQCAYLYCCAVPVRVLLQDSMVYMHTHVAAHAAGGGGRERRGQEHSLSYEATRQFSAITKSVSQNNTKSDEIGARQRPSMSIQTQETPNPNSMIFVLDTKVLEPGQTMNFHNIVASAGSPFAKTIFGINGVKSVLVGHEFVTVTKQTDNQWMLMKPAIVAAITDFFANDLPVVTGAIPTRETQINEDDDETVRMIKEILDSKIRPRAQEDGGDAVFVDFKDGVLRLKMIGACSSCPNSVVTLKSGIQNMMQFYVPEVLSVERVDEVEHIEQSQANQFTE